MKRSVRIGPLSWILFLSSFVPVALVACGTSRPEPAKSSSAEREQKAPMADAPADVAPAASPPEAAMPTSGGDLMLVLPDFELTDQDGNSFGSRQLYTKAWIANFIFTRCTATCPAQTARLAELQRALRRHPGRKDIQLVSITVDPEFDTPEVLRAYAGGAGADPNQWKFLTGSREAIWRISSDGFKLAVGQGDATMPIFHSPMFALVDPYLRVRGFYDVLSGDGIDQLQNDMNMILRERGPEPPEVANPLWIAGRRLAQLRTRDQFKVRCDFSFSDKIDQSGIRFRNRVVDDAAKTYKPVHYDHGNGVAIADVDGDGLSDIYFLSQVGGNELWKNLGEGRFEDITQQADVGLADRIGVTASFGDIDNDGDPDLFVTTVRGGNAFLENDGSGTFTDITRQAGLEYSGHSSGIVLFDFDRDGLLDVFLTNVGKYTTDELVEVARQTVRRDGDQPYHFYAGVLDGFGGHLKPEERNEASILYRNLGGHRFEDVSAKVALVDVSWSGDAAPVDFNQDGWLDLYVLNMQGHDEYYENVDGTRFQKKSREVFPKTPWGSMGIKAFDYDNDGDLDLFITDMHSDMSEDVGPEDEKRKSNMQWPPSYTLADGQDIWGNAFYQNQGGGTFQEVSDRIGAENYWPWGISVGDLNADGFDDVFIASSMNYPFRYGVNTVLLNNLGEGFLDSEFILSVEPRSRGFMIPAFEIDFNGQDRDHPLAQRIIERTARLPAENVPKRFVVWSALGSRSSVIFDLDDDGDLDIVTNEFNSEPMVLLSDLAQRHPGLRYLKVKLEGNKSNRDGLGAAVTVHAGGNSWTKVYDGVSGYLSHSLYPLYFGLGDAESVDKVEVRWPSGTSQLFSGSVAVNSTILIEEAGQTDR